MALDTIIRDGTGSGNDAKVTSDNALKVSTVDISISDQTIDDLTVKKQYRDWLRNSAGSADMNVDGSSTPVEFEETAEASKVKWLTSWRLIMHDESMELDTNDFRRFGTAAIAPGLTNGIECYFKQGGRKVDVFLENVKMIGNFLDYADGYLNLINAISAQGDYLSFDFIFDQPVVLPAGSNDSIIMKISDDLSSLALMKVVIRGWQVFTVDQGIS